VFLTGPGATPVMAPVTYNAATRGDATPSALLTNGVVAIP
jgi:hypothetical protein